MLSLLGFPTYLLRYLLYFEPQGILGNSVFCVGSRTGQIPFGGISDTTILCHPPAHCQPMLRGQSDEWREEERLGCLSWPLSGGWAKLCSEPSLHAPSPVSPQRLTEDLYSFFTSFPTQKHSAVTLCRWVESDTGELTLMHLWVAQVSREQPWQ